MTLSIMTLIIATLCIFTRDKMTFSTTGISRLIIRITIVNMLAKLRHEAFDSQHNNRQHTGQFVILSLRKICITTPSITIISKAWPNIMTTNIKTLSITIGIKYAAKWLHCDTHPLYRVSSCRVSFRRMSWPHRDVSMDWKWIFDDVGVVVDVDNDVGRKLKRLNGHF
jgi:hypothetical protein